MSAPRSSWPEVSLGEVCEFKYGKSLPESARAGGAVPVFGSNGQVGNHDEALTAGPTIVIGRKGSFGEVNFSPSPCWPIDTTYYVDRTTTKADLRWLTYRLASLGLNKLNKAAAVPGLNREDAYRQRLLLPSLPEQRRIAEILDKADGLRAKRRAALAQIDTLTQSIFLDMFGDPATNPKGWKFNRLDELCEVGSSKRVFVEELVDEGVPFYRGTEIGKLGEGRDVTPSLFIATQHFESLKAQAGVPSKGDLLLASICPDGRIYMVADDKPFYFKDARVLWIKVDHSKIDCVFLKHYLKHLFIASYSKIASGTTFAELKIVVLKSLGIPAVPRRLQQSFASLVESIERQEVRCRTQRAELESLFASFQHRAFAGGSRV